MSDPRFEGKEPYSDELLAEVEKRLGRELPRDYRDFVKQYGGAFVGGAVDGSTAWSVLGFYKAASILERISFFTELTEQGALNFARDELGNMWVLAGDNSIHFLVTYAGKSSAEKVSDSFQDFLDRIVPDEEEDEDEEDEEDDEGK
jgi:hypothetical protein